MKGTDKPGQYLPALPGKRSAQWHRHGDISDRNRRVETLLVAQ